MTRSNAKPGVQKETTEALCQHIGFKTGITAATSATIISLDDNNITIQFQIPGNHKLITLEKKYSQESFNSVFAEKSRCSDGHNVTLAAVTFAQIWNSINLQQPCSKGSHVIAAEEQPPVSYTTERAAGASSISQPAL